MKERLLCILALASGLSAAGCGGDGGSTTADTSATSGDATLDSAGPGADAHDAAAADATVDVALDTASAEDALPDAGADASAPDADAASDSAGGDADAATITDYSVGVVNLSVTTAAGRVLPVAVWYPAAADQVGDPAVYLGLMAGTARAGVPIADGGPWPLVVFSHGSGGLKEQSLFLTEQLAGKGYVVAAPDHIGNTFLTQDDDQMAVVAVERPRDCSAVIDRFEAPQPDDPAWFSTHVDLERAAAVGHSFGGYTAIALAGGVLSVPPDVAAQCETPDPPVSCQLLQGIEEGPFDRRDERIDLALAMTPGGYLAFREVGLAGVDVPTMIMAGKMDTMTPWGSEIVPIYEGIPTEKHLWSLEHGEHFTFSDICLLLPFLPPDIAAQFGSVCAEDAPLPIEEAQRLIFDMSLAFLDAGLKDDAEARARLDPAWAEAQSTEVRMISAPAGGTP
jgi:predicted dienelactone hydrolase